MNAAVIGFLIASAVLALLNWVACGLRSTVVDRAARPIVIGLLMSAVIAADLNSAAVRGWLLAGLGFCCLADVAAATVVRPEPATASIVRTSRFDGPSRPTEPADPQLVITLGAVGIACVNYEVALGIHNIDQIGIVCGLVLVLATVFAFGYRVIGGALQDGGPLLVIAVAIFMAVLGALVVLGTGTSSLLLGYGSIAFALAFLVAGADRFTVRNNSAPLVTLVLYHAAQLGLVIGLIR